MNSYFKKVPLIFGQLPDGFIIILLASILAYIATLYSFLNNLIIAYGDAEAHLNIAKRVIDSITPGFAQLGGVWLPLPHLMMVPFVYFDFLWRTGLAGSIVSGICFLISCLFLYKIGLLLTNKKLPAFVGFLFFATNPNILYLQSTPLTETPLITFFILSTYYFILYLQGKNRIISLVLTAFFGFCATLSRYDGWFLVMSESLLIFVFQYLNKSKWGEIKGILVLFCTLAFFGIFIWLSWDGLILGNPLYFSNSQYSARSQQIDWQNRGQLPAFHNIGQSLLYFTVDTIDNTGQIIFFLALIGLILFITKNNSQIRFYVAAILLAPFAFNIISLFLGQSVILLPEITPKSFDWNLFNVRYGVTMMPAAALFIGFLFSKIKINLRLLVMTLWLFQITLFMVGFAKVIDVADGTEGLSAGKKTDSQLWLRNHYDGGLVLLDDYAHTVTIIYSNIPMQSVIYIGTKPYWEEELNEPEKYATWIVMQRNDAVWNNIYEKPDTQARLYKYFNKVYTSPDILIFKRIANFSG